MVIIQRFTAFTMRNDQISVSSSGRSQKNAKVHNGLQSRNVHIFQRSQYITTEKKHKNAYPIKMKEPTICFLITFLLKWSANVNSFAIISPKCTKQYTAKLNATNWKSGQIQQQCN